MLVHDAIRTGGSKRFKNLSVLAGAEGSTTKNTNHTKRVKAKDGGKNLKPDGTGHHGNAPSQLLSGLGCSWKRLTQGSSFVATTGLICETPLGF